MTVQDIKRAAFTAAKHEDVSMEQDLCGLNVQESLYYMQMVYYYRLFDAGKIKLSEARQAEQRIIANYSRLDNALRLSQENYHRTVALGLETNSERTKLVKQIRAGDRDFIITLLHLLDLYTGENIYCKIYQLMKSPLTDDELDAMIAECPEEYRRGMTEEEARTAVWRVIRHLNGDSEISTKEGEAVEKQTQITATT